MSLENKIKIDIIRTLASRPECLKVSTASLLKYLKFSGDFRWLLHEDVLNKDASKHCVKYTESTELFNVIKVNDPPIGQSESLTWLLENVSTKYILNWEDDWELLRTIDLDLIVDLMDKNLDINQIAFHKRKLVEHLKVKTDDDIGDGYIRKKIRIQTERDGVYLITNQHWAFTPSIIRMSFIKAKWNILKFRKNRLWKNNPVWVVNPYLKRLEDPNQHRSIEWMMENIGCYFLGEFRDPVFIKHLGFQKSVREKQMKWKGI